MAYRYDFVIEKGASLALDIECQDEDGQPVTLSGCTAAAQLRYRHADPDPAAVFHASVDAPRGRVSLRLDPAQTAALGKATAVWDCALTWPDAGVQRLAQGKVAISPEVTR